jgi:hypothetical protein
MSTAPILFGNDAGLKAAYQYSDEERQKLLQITDPHERGRLELAIQIAHMPAGKNRAAYEKALLANLKAKGVDPALRAKVEAVLRADDSSKASGTDILKSLLNTDGFLPLSAQDKVVLNATTDLKATQDELLNAVAARGAGVTLSAAELGMLGRKPV